MHFLSKTRRFRVLRCIEKVSFFLLFLAFKCIDHFALLYLFSLKTRALEIDWTGNSALANKTIAANNTPSISMDTPASNTLILAEYIFVQDTSIYKHFSIIFLSFPRLAYNLFRKEAALSSIDVLFYIILAINVVEFGILGELAFLLAFFYFFGDVFCAHALEMVLRAPVLTWLCFLSTAIFIWATSKLTGLFFTLLPKKQDGVSPIVSNPKHIFDKDNKVIYNNISSAIWTLFLHILILSLKTISISLVSFVLFTPESSVFVCIGGFFLLLFSINVYACMDIYFYPFKNLTQRYTLFFLFFFLFSIHFFKNVLPAFSLCPSELTKNDWRFIMCKIDSMMERAISILKAL